MRSTSVGTCPACDEGVRLGLAVDPEDPPRCSLLAGDRERADDKIGGNRALEIATGVAEDEEGALGATPDNEGGANDDGGPTNGRLSSTTGSSFRGTSSDMSRYVPDCSLLVTVSMIQGSCRGASISNSIFCRALANCSGCGAHRSK